jgi:hypothetical protein
VLAAQIEVESQFDAAKVGPEGEKGISQLPKHIFTVYGRDDDNNGTVSVLDPADSIFAQARYLCELADDVKKLLDAKKVKGDRLTLTLWAYDIGLDAVEQAGGKVPFDSYPFRVRSSFATYLVDEDAAADDKTEPDSEDAGQPASAEPSQPPPGSAPSSELTEARFQQMFPNRNAFYTFEGLTTAMKKYPAFATTGDEAIHKREVAAFLANVNQESGGLVYMEEINQAVWGTYCEPQPYGCPAGEAAYHGRGPIQLSWNTNYKAAGDALGLDLLNSPDLVKTDAAVAWETALWFWMTQSGAGSMTPHSAITGNAGFGETIRSINGKVECYGRAPDLVQNRISSYQKFSEILAAEPGDKLSC